MRVTTKTDHVETEVRFLCSAPGRNQVFLAGSFNGWRTDELPMGESKPGLWSAAVRLPPGDHQFKFFADGEWCDELEAKCVPFSCQRLSNSFGTQNFRIEVVPT
jgi:1,4-alpha-glucan branching enzyme